LEMGLPTYQEWNKYNLHEKIHSNFIFENQSLKTCGSVFIYISANGKNSPSVLPLLQEVVLRI